jgi:hypothetical protein
MLYNSDNFAVVLFDVPMPTPGEAAGEAPAVALTRGGYEIVDKFARKEIYIDGALAEQFKQGVEALIRQAPSEDEIDAYLSRFTALAHQPVVMH